MSAKGWAWAAGVAVVAVTAVGCGGSGGGSAKSSAAPAASSPVKSAAPAAAAAPQVPTVAMGQTVTVHTTPDGLITKAAGSYEVTLTGLKTATSVTDQSDGYTAKADAGKVIGCLSLKVKNTGTVASELYPFTDPQWQGASGQVAGSELASGVSCSSIGVAGDDLSGAPDPGPGQFATGSDAVEFPTGGGQLVFVDRSGAQLFKVAVPG